MSTCRELLGTMTLRHSCLQRMDDLGSLHCGLLHKHIWEDAERGNGDHVQFFTSMLTKACTNANQLEVTIDVPMLGTIIEQNGDGLLEQSHMPVGWPLHIDGAVRQNCAHRGTTLQELDNLLGEYDLKRDLVEINRKAPQWSHNAVWNKNYMEPGQVSPYNNCGRAQSQPSHRKHPSYEVKDCDIRRAVTALAAVPAATLSDSTFLSALGTQRSESHHKLDHWHNEQ